MPYLMAACDIYAGPSRLEGFGMPQVEANACGKPVIGIKAMGCATRMVHGETALPGRRRRRRYASRRPSSAQESGYEEGHRIVFEQPRTADYRASVHDIANYLLELMEDPGLRVAHGPGRAATRGRAVRLPRRWRQTISSSGTLMWRVSTVGNPAEARLLDGSNGKSATASLPRAQIRERKPAAALMKVTSHPSNPPLRSCYNASGPTSCRARRRGATPSPTRAT